eukprot:5837648-Prymnesium_polylepis.2
MGIATLSGKCKCWHATHGRAAVGEGSLTPIGPSNKSVWPLGVLSLRWCASREECQRVHRDGHAERKGHRHRIGIKLQGASAAYTSAEDQGGRIRGTGACTCHRPWPGSSKPPPSTPASLRPITKRCAPVPSARPRRSVTKVDAPMRPRSVASLRT